MSLNSHHQHQMLRGQQHLLLDLLQERLAYLEAMS